MGDPRKMGLSKPLPILISFQISVGKGFESPPTSSLGPKVFCFLLNLRDFKEYFVLVPAWVPTGSIILLCFVSVKTCTADEYYE